MGHLYGKRDLRARAMLGAATGNGSCALRRTLGTAVRSPAWRRSFGVHSLIVNGEAIGTLSIQDNGLMHPGPDPEFDSNALARRRHLAAAVAEHLSLAVANLSLRESLRLQAVRDPLTGLYNRRYMQEFLERELHSARRKRRPLPS